MDCCLCYRKMITLPSQDGTKRQTFNIFQIIPYYTTVNLQLGRLKSELNKVAPFQAQFTRVIHPCDPRDRKFHDARKGISWFS